MSGFSESLRPEWGESWDLVGVTFMWHAGPPAHARCPCGWGQGLQRTMFWGTHTRHRVLILDDDLSQEPSLIVLVHGGRGGARSRG